MVWVPELPGETLPQFIVVRGIVQAESLKMPKFMAVIVPEDGSVCDVVSAPAVVMISRVLVMAITIKARVPSFFCTI